MQEKESGTIAPIARRVYATITNKEFSTFLGRAREDGYGDAEGRVDIEAVLTKLLGAYNEGCIVILKKHDIEEAKKKLAKEKVASAKFYGVEKESV